MSNALDMRAVINALLPPGELWEPKIDGDFDKFFDGMAANADDTRLFLKLLGSIRDPFKTPYLDDLEHEYGIVKNSLLTEQERRDALGAIVYARPGTGSATDLETILINAGFDVKVINNSPPIDPDQFLDVAALMVAGGDNAYAGEPTAVAGWEQTPGELIVNGPIYTQSSAYLMEAGGEFAFAGNSRAVAGYFTFVQRDPIEYMIPRNNDTIEDGDMEKVGIADWTPNATATVTKETGAAVDGLGTQVLRVTFNGGGEAAKASQDIAYTLGDLYVLTGWARSDGSHRPRVQVADGGPSWLGEITSDWQFFVLPFIADRAELALTSSATIATRWDEFDNLVFYNFWNFVFFICGDVSGYDEITDANMEKPGVSNWIPGDKTSVQKVSSPVATGNKSLKVIAENNNDKQELIAVQPDASLLANYRMWGDVDIHNLALKNFLIDGDMEKKVDVIVDGMMERSGISDWTAGGGATLTKETGTPYNGSQVLRVTDAASSGSAYQTVLTVTKKYRVRGVVRSGGTSVPSISDDVATYWTGDDSIGWQPFDFEFVAAGTSIYFEKSSLGNYVEFDAIEVIDQAASVADYTAYAGATLTKETTNPYSGEQVLRITDPGNGAAYQDTLTIGDVYRARGQARGDGGSGFPRFGDGITFLWTGTTSSSFQEFDVNFIANHAWLTLYKHGGSGYADFDAVHVSKIPQLEDGDMERPETLLPDGDCEKVGVADWTAGNSATLTKQTDAYKGILCLRIAYNGVTNPQAYQSPFTVGKTYRVKGVARSDGTWTPRVYMTGIGNIWSGTISTSWQDFNETFVATAATVYLQSAATSAGYIEFDDLELTLIDESLLEDGDMENPVTSDWSIGNSAILEKRTVNPYEGLRSLRVLFDGVAGPYAYQAKTISGIEYRITGAFRGDGANTASVKHGTTNIVTSTVSADWQTFDETFTPTHAQLRLVSDSTGTGEYAEFDNIILIPTGFVMNWIPGTSTKLSKQPGKWFDGAGKKILRVEETATGAAEASQNILTDNEYYRITGWARSDGSAVPQISFGSTVVYQTNNSPLWQEVNAVGQANGTQLILEAWGATAGDYTEWDDIVITPVLATAPAANNGAGPGQNAYDPSETGPRFRFIADNSNYIDAGTVFNSLQTVTVSGWFELLDVTDIAFLFCKYENETDSWGVSVSGGILKIFDDIDNAQTNRYPIAVAINTRYHIAAVLNSNFENKLYINGVLVGSGEFSSDNWASFAGNFTIGARNSTIRFMDGFIYPGFQVFTEEKSASWVATEYQRGLDTALLGSYVEQILEEPFLADRDISGTAWSLQPGWAELPGLVGVPMLAFKDSITGLWEFVWIGFNLPLSSPQPISGNAPNGFSAIRLYDKFARFQETYFDDLSTIKPVFTPAVIPGQQKDQFRKLVLKYKPLHSWALAMIQNI